MTCTTQIVIIVYVILNLFATFSFFSLKLSSLFVDTFSMKAIYYHYCDFLVTQMPSDFTGVLQEFTNIIISNNK